MVRLGVVLLLLALAFSIWWTINSALYSPESDFDAFYYAAKVVADPDTPNSCVYDHQTVAYIYSIAAAYLLTPLALIPYEWSRLIFYIASLVAYLAAIVSLLRWTKPSLAWALFLIAFTLTWPPFLSNQHYGQVNTILLLLVTSAILNVRNPLATGILVGVAGMFKLFPLAISLAFVVKNWRITLSAFSVVALSTTIPGASGWLSAIKTGLYPHYTVFYKALGASGFYVFAISIVMITVLITYRARHINKLTLTSFVIPATFLIMPITEYHHFVMLILPFLYLLTTAKPLLPLLIRILYYIHLSSSLMLLWFLLGYHLLKEGAPTSRPEALGTEIR